MCEDDEYLYACVDSYEVYTQEGTSGMLSNTFCTPYTCLVQILKEDLLSFTRSKVLLGKEGLVLCTEVLPKIPESR